MFKVRSLPRLKQLSLIGLVFVLTGVLGASGAPQPLVTILGSQDAVNFTVQKTGIASLQVQIYDLTGRSLYQSDWAKGSTLSWPLITRNGQRIANGVYLYALRAKDTAGQLSQKVGKLAVTEQKAASISELPSSLPTLEELESVIGQHTGSYDVNHGATNAYNINAKYVGIGLTNPAHKLDILAASGVNPLRVRVGGMTVLRALANGDVGIGTASPTGRLHVIAPDAPKSAILAERTSFTYVEPAILAISHGAGSAVMGMSEGNDFGILGRNNGGSPAVYGCSPCPFGAYPGSPFGDIGVAGFTASGSANSVAVMAQTNACGQLFVGQSAGTTVFTVDCAGNLTASGTKSFVQDDPNDSTKQIVYVALEGPEAGTYTRGTAQLTNGEAVIALPEHFSLVTNDEGLTVQLTPSGEWLQLYVVQKSTKQIIVREANGKSGQFDYLVQGVRKGFENHQVIQEKEVK